MDAILKYYFNMMEYDGPVAEDKGKLKMDVFNEHLIKRRVAAAEELNLMLMRSSRPQAVGRRGVHLDINGGRLELSLIHIYVHLHCWIACRNKKQVNIPAVFTIKHKLI